MKVRHFLKFGLAVVALATTLAGCGGSDDDPVPNIAEVAKEQGFNTLLTASTKAGIAGTLADANAQLTVFAPTDQAFTDLGRRLGFADGAAMVNALPASALQSILTYHVLGTK